MNIQSGYGVSSNEGIDWVGSSEIGAAGKSKAADALAWQGGSSSTQVSISDAARKVAGQQSSTTQGRTQIQEKLLSSAASDPASAEKLAYEMGNTSSTIFFDLRGIGGSDPVNKLSSGRVIDVAFKEKFKIEASAIDVQRKALYDSEKAKGTPADQILAKIFDFTNSQSNDYLEASGWLESLGGKAV